MEQIIEKTDEQIMEDMDQMIKDMTARLNEFGHLTSMTAETPIGVCENPNTQYPTYGEFVAEMGEVPFITVAREIFKIENDYHESGSWDIPSYDFGHLFDPNHPDNIIEDDRIALNGITMTSLSCAARLVKPEAALLFSFGNTRILLVHRYRLTDCEWGQSKTFRLEYYSKKKGGSWGIIRGADHQKYVNLWYSAFNVLCNNDTTTVVSGGGTVEVANRRRQAGRKKLLPETVIVSLAPSQQMPSLGVDDFGGGVA